MDRSNLIKVAKYYGLQIICSPELTIEFILEKQGDILASAREMRNLKSHQEKLAQVLSELEHLRVCVRDLTDEVEALRLLFMELDDEAVRYRLEATGAIRPDHLLTFSRAVLERICETLTIEFKPSYSKRVLVGRISERLKKLGFAKRSLEEFEKYRISKKRDVEIALYEAMSKGKMMELYDGSGDRKKDKAP